MKISKKSLFVSTTLSALSISFVSSYGSLIGDCKIISFALDKIKLFEQARKTANFNNEQNTKEKLLKKIVKNEKLERNRKNCELIIEIKQY